ncbi:MAG: hypothetical protein JW839_01820 [Candidatus Lokiarchaeota archaeon]|nr:hypothetical protein [Candidatus Lokiarchaeota archaeon]
MNAQLLRVLTVVNRTCIIFLFIFMSYYFIGIPSIAASKGLMPALDATFNVLTGVAFDCLLAFALLVSRYRISGFVSFVLGAIWFLVPGDWILRHGDTTRIAYADTYNIVVGIFVILLANGALQMTRFLVESIALGMRKKSWILGPWFPAFPDRGDARRLPEEQRVVVKRGARVTIVIALVALPGVLATVGATPVPVTITPGSQQVKFSFFAPNNDSGLYTPALCAELERHGVNLDLAMSVSNASIPFLAALEAAMPSITYRVHISPPRIDKLAETVQAATELMRVCETNGTLDQWLGFFFDIEGEGYRWSEAFPSVVDSILEWNTMFDYIDAASAARNRTIETESVASYTDIIDQAYDGDFDIQALEGYNGAVPDRFTTYAPMIYRCLVDEPQKPWSPLEPWGTSYFVYTKLFTLSSRIAPARRGIYLGPTNTSCYSRDLYQPDLVSWGAATGFDNLVRDTLVAKSFGCTEVTYFLLWDAAGFGGMFSSYGMDALDRMNASVNENPPASFDICYNYRDANLWWLLGRDLMCDLSKPTGAALVVLAWVTALLIALLLAREPRERSSR